MQQMKTSNSVAAGQPTNIHRQCDGEAAASFSTTLPACSLLVTPSLCGKLPLSPCSLSAPSASALSTETCCSTPAERTTGRNLSNQHLISREVPWEDVGADELTDQDDCSSLTPQLSAVLKHLQEGPDRGGVHLSTFRFPKGKAETADGEQEDGELAVLRHFLATSPSCFVSTLPTVTSPSDLPAASMTAPLSPSSPFARRYIRDYHVGGEGVRLNCVADDDDSFPFLLVDIQRVITQYRQWQLLLPRVTPYYAVKCNNDPVLLLVLTALGCHFDCASPIEMQQIFEVRRKLQSILDSSSPHTSSEASHGAFSKAPDYHIVFANPCKQRSALRFAATHNVSRTVFDNQDELKKIKAVHPTAELLLRIQTDDSHAVCPLSCKYGAPRATWRVLLQKAKALDLNVVGVCFHVGSGCQDRGAFHRALNDAAEVFQTGEEEGFAFSVLDIGGGFPGALDDSPHKEEGIPFQLMAQEINDSLAAHFPETTGTGSTQQRNPVQIIAEPGRYFACAATTMAVRVFSRRCPPTGEQDGYLYYVNDGLYGSFNCLLYDHAEVHPILLRSRGHASGWLDALRLCEPTFRSSLFGPTCDGFDVLLKDVKMPLLHVGDYVVFKNMGAYTTSAGSTFNGFSKAPSHYCRLIRES